MPVLCIDAVVDTDSGKLLVEYNDGSFKVYTLSMLWLAGLVFLRASSFRWLRPDQVSDIVHAFNVKQREHYEFSKLTPAQKEALRIDAILARA